nr:MAG TPA: protein of unknown function (DUF4750) [Caudoviricetes sp.]
MIKENNMRRVDYIVLGWYLAWMLVFLTALFK